MRGMAAFQDLILSRVERELTKEITPYRAIVTGIADGKVQFRPVEAATGTSQLYARIAGSVLAVNDEVLVIGRRNPIVIGKIQRSP